MRTPGSPRAIAATRAAATSAAAIGRTARGVSQLSGREKRIASASIGRAGWPSASRSPSRSEGRAIDTEAKPRPLTAASASPLTRL